MNPRFLIPVATVFLVGGFFAGYYDCKNANRHRSTQSQLLPFKTIVTGTTGYPFGRVYARLNFPADPNIGAFGVATVTSYNAQQCLAADLVKVPCEMPISTVVGPERLDENGSFTMPLYANSEIKPRGSVWIFTIASCPEYSREACTAAESSTVVNGAIQDITSNLGAVAPAHPKIPPA